MALKRISFQSIPVDDQDRALAFYRDVLGFAVQTDAPFEPGWRWIFLTIPGSDSRSTRP
jgi:catechol 2,3-dioxygenase-like lactoylglutathione lyase family enzyme